MADTNEELVGAIGVSITGDYSSLAASYSTAQDQAQAAGAAVAGAFNSGVGSISDAAEVVDGSLSGVGKSLGEVAEQMAAVGEALVITEGFADFAKEALAASDSITQASIALTTMTGSAEVAHDTIEQLEQLGIADGLAMPSLLTAADRMTAMRPAGTNVVNLLGDIANGAAAMGTNIDQAANRFDQIINAGTLSARSLTSMGLSLTTVANALNQLDPSADATSASIAAMFKAMDPGARVQVLQQALQNLGGVAKQVAEDTFGGQWQSLADAWDKIMVQVGQAITPIVTDLISLTKTEIVPFIQEVTTGFKNLSPGVQDLVISVGVLGPAAIALTGALGAFGLALSGLTTLGTAVSGVLKTVGITFADTGAAATVAAPEIVAVAAAEEAAGSAAVEASAQMDLFATSVISANWSEQAEQLTLFSEAEMAAATGAADAGEAATAMGGAMALAATGGVIVLAGTIGSLIGWYEAWKNAGEQSAKTQQELSDQAEGLESVLTKQKVPFQVLVDAYNNSKISIQQLVAGLQGLETAYENSVTKSQNVTNNSLLMQGAIQTLTEKTTQEASAFEQSIAVFGAVQIAQAAGLATSEQWAAAAGAVATAANAIPGGLNSATAALIADQLAALKAVNAYESAAGAYQQLLAQFNAGAPIQAEVTTALGKMEAAENAAAAAGVPVAGSLASINEKAAAVINNLGSLATASQVAAAQTKAQADAITDDNAQVEVLQQKLVLLTDQQSKVASQVQAGTAQYSQQLAIEEQVVKTSNDLIAALDKQATAQLNQGNAAAIAGGQVGILKQEQDAANLALDQATQKADAGTISITAYAAAQKAAVTATVNLAVGVAEANSGMQGSTGAADEAGVAYAGAKGKLDALTQAYKDNKVAVSDVVSAQNAVLAAQIELNVANAENATGLQGATDAYSLNVIAVAAAQAKYDTLAEAYKTNITLAPQVEAAQKALTTAQKSQNDAVAAASPLIVAQNTDLQSLIDTQNKIPTVVQATTTSLNQQVTAIQGIGAAIQQVQNDLANAMQLTDIGKASGSFGAPPGYVADTSITPGVNGGGSSVVAFIETPAHVAQRLHTAGYSPQQISSIIGYPLDVVLQWLGIAPAATTLTGVTGQAPAGSNAGALGTTFGGGLTPVPITGPGLPTGSTSTASAPVASASGSGTAAVDGGSYPAVTAHQASGEVWSVTGGTGSGGVSAASAATITTTIQNTVASSSGNSAVASAVEAVGGAVAAIQTNSANLGSISQSLATVASSVEQIATAVGGAVQRLNTSGAVSSAAPATYSGSSGSAYSVGTPTTTVGGGAGNGIIVPIVSPPPENNVPGYNPFGPGSAPINVTLTVNATGGGSGTQLAAAIQPAVTQGLVAALRTAGARF